MRCLNGLSASFMTNTANTDTQNFKNAKFEQAGPVGEANTNKYKQLLTFNKNYHEYQERQVMTWQARIYCSQRLVCEVYPRIMFVHGDNDRKYLTIDCCAIVPERSLQCNE